MDKYVKKSKIQNLLFHLNNLLLISLIHFFGREGFPALWFFTPFILIAFTTTMLEMSWKAKDFTFRRLATTDFSIRAIILLINFFALSEILSLPMTYLMGINILMLLGNTILERQMHKHLDDVRFVDLMDETLSKQEIDTVIKNYIEAENIDSSTKENRSIHAVALVGWSNFFCFY